MKYAPLPYFYSLEIYLLLFIADPTTNATKTGTTTARKTAATDGKGCDWMGQMDTKSRRKL